MKSAPKKSRNQMRQFMRMLKAMTLPPKAEADAIQNVLSDIKGRPVYDRHIQIYEKTIKGDRRAIEFLITHALSAYTTDPDNLGLEAPTSTGKTYPTVEVTKRSPKDDILYLGGLSPTALVHDYGELVDEKGNPIEATIESLHDQIRFLKEAGKERQGDLKIIREELKELLKKARYIIDMENKIIVFLEAPCPETWEKLRPILSHDTFEISYKFTDKTGAGQLRTSHVVIRGWPAVIYLKASRQHGEDAIWDEIQSRFTTISPKTDFNKFREAIALVALRKGLPGPIFEHTLKFGEFKWLENVLLATRWRLLEIKNKVRKVCQEKDASMFWIPFYEEIGREFPAKEGRHMRDSRRFLTLLQMSAAIDVFNRPILKIGEAEFIVVVREDYERAVRLFFGEAGEEIFSGLPRHVIDFFQKIPLKMSKEGAQITVSKMVEKSKEFGRPISDQSIYKRYIPALENTGLLSSEPDPEDKRQKIFKVLREEIMPEKSCICCIFDNNQYFNAPIFEKRLNEVLKLLFPEGVKVEVLDWDGTPLSKEQLWGKYYSKESDSWKQYLKSQQTAPIEENRGKNVVKSENTIIPTISASQSTIEDVGKIGEKTACAKCGATNQGIIHSTNGTPLCHKCSHDFKGDL